MNNTYQRIRRSYTMERLATAVSRRFAPVAPEYKAKILTRRLASVNGQIVAATLDGDPGDFVRVVNVGTAADAQYE